MQLPLVAIAGWLLFDEGAQPLDRPRRRHHLRRQRLHRAPRGATGTACGDDGADRSGEAGRIAQARSQKYPGSGAIRLITSILTVSTATNDQRDQPRHSQAFDHEKILPLDCPAADPEHPCICPESGVYLALGLMTRIMATCSSCSYKVSDLPALRECCTYLTSSRTALSCATLTPSCVACSWRCYAPRSRTWLSLASAMLTASCIRSAVWHRLPRGCTGFARGNERLAASVGTRQSLLGPAFRLFLRSIAGCSLSACVWHRCRA